MSKRNRYEGLGNPITDKECAAITLLSEGGWDSGEIKLAFGFSNNEIALNHIEGRCEHGKRISHLKLNNIKDEIEINNNLNKFECTAMSLLNDAEWSYKTLKMVFELNKYGISKHVKNNCNHEDLSYLLRI